MLFWAFFSLTDFLLMFSDFIFYEFLCKCISLNACVFSLAHPVLSYSGYIIYHHYYIHLNSMKREKVDLGRWGCGEDLGMETNQSILH